jgi:hypothetical protein
VLPAPASPQAAGPASAASPSPAARDFAAVITQELSVVQARTDAAADAAALAAARAAAPARGRHGVRHAAALGRRGPVGTAVAGSVLDPQTWRQVTHALQGRARR